MGNELDEFNAETPKTSTVKPASEAWGETPKDKETEVYTKECIVCDEEFSHTRDEAGLCSKCKNDMNLLIKNR